jgi:type II secretory pathway pseudopilin PulG
MNPRRARQRLMNDGGFTIMEVLAAIGVLVIAVLSLLTATTSGIATVDMARRSSTAVFLAEHRMEQIKAFAMSSMAGQGWNGVTAASFPPDGYGTALPIVIDGVQYPDYRRTVTVTTPAPKTKAVSIQVFYRHATEGGSREAVVSVATSLVDR